MSASRSIKLDVVAIMTAALGVFLSISLLTYDRTDPPSDLIWPPAQQVQNSCGMAGAYVAHNMLQMMGLGAYYAVGSLIVVTVFMFLQRPIDQPVLRTLGWALSLLAISTMAAMIAPQWSPGPVVGSGGYLGAMGRAWLESNFAATGSFILVTTLLLAGLLLSTDYFMFHAAATATVISGAGLAKAGKLSHAVASRRLKRVKTDLDNNEEWADEEQDEIEAEEDDEWEYEEEDEYEYEDEEESESDDEIPIKTPTSKTNKNAAPDEDVTEAVETATKVGAAAAAAGLAGGLKNKLTAALTGKKEAAAEQVESTEQAEKPAEASLPIKTKPKSERDEIIDQLEAADHDSDIDTDYELPPVELLLAGEEVSYEAHEQEVRRKAKILEKTFENFGFNVKVVEVETGPVIAQYEVELEAGLRLSKITGLADDLAIALRAPSVRIVAPIPGKNTVGIEVPNENRQLVRLREVIEETNGRAQRMKIPIYLGKDVAGSPMVVDLAALPHLLIAGRTGTGKSVCLNSIILSILMSRGPDEVRMLMIDPKMVELSGYRKLPHLMHPVVTDMKKAEAILAWAVDKMEERYQLLANAGVRHVSVYNQLTEDELRDRIEPESEEAWHQTPKQLPFIVIVADEMADLMMTAGKDVEQHIIRLAQKSRAVGIHLILATQKPTVDVITGLIKSNLPARIAFQVASRTDSRVVLDEMGADKLLGNGDMLFLSPGTSMLLRGQGTYLSDDEITKVVDFVGTDDQQFATELMQLKTEEEQEATAGPGFKERDDLYEAAVDVVIRERRGSVSLLQRCLGIGYGRAARLIDFMAEDGIVGPYNGSNAREVMMSVEDWESRNSDEAVPPTEASASSTFSTNDAPAPWEDEETDELEEDDEASTEDDELGEDEEWEYEDEEASDEEDEYEDEELEDDSDEDDQEWEEEEDEEEAA